MNQWRKEYEKSICRGLGMQAAIGTLGGGQTDSTISHDIVVATAQSACRYQLLQDNQRGLLIADECHHYGAETGHGAGAWAEHRLGLTATYEREDDGCAKNLDPYFGGTVYSLDYEEALADGVIANFKIAFVARSSC